jgi:hypothetical protein
MAADDACQTSRGTIGSEPGKAQRPVVFRYAALMARGDARFRTLTLDESGAGLPVSRFFWFGLSLILYLGSYRQQGAVAQAIAQEGNGCH